MTGTMLDKARLAAFVDGELTPEDAAEVVMHLASHPVDQAYVDELMALNVMIADAYDAPLQEPAPAAILATIAADGEASDQTRVVSIAAWMRTRAPVVWGGGAALAAGFASLLVLSDLGASDPAKVAVGPLAADHAQSLALNELDAGRSRRIGDDAEFSVTASFQTPDKGVCREFRVTREADAGFHTAIACPSSGGAGGWMVEVADAVASGEAATSFTPASGQHADPIGDFLDTVGAGRALTPEEEAIARAQDWRSVE